MPPVGQEEAATNAYLELGSSSLQSQVSLPGQLLQCARLRQNITNGHVLLSVQHLYQVQHHANLTLQVICLSCIREEMIAKYPLVNLPWLEHLALLT